MNRHLHGAGAALLILASAGLAWYGQPTPGEKWEFLAPELESSLTERRVQIDPAELLNIMYNDYIDLWIIDVRDEREWNLFHLWGAERIPPEELFDHRRRFAELPENGVLVFVSNDETKATRAWQLVMAAASRPNAYILSGGINRWLDEFSPRKSARREGSDDEPDGTVRHPLKWALGSRHPASLPDLHHSGTPRFVEKVKLQKRVVKKGGCG